MGLRGLAAGAAVAAMALRMAPGAALAATKTVSATPSDTFDSSDVTVTVGDTVTWVNNGGLHNVVFDDGMFTQPAMPMSAPWSATVSRTFGATGTYTYYCAQHRILGMTGVVRVVANGGSPPSAGSPPTGSPPPGSPSPGSPPGGQPGSGAPPKSTVPVHVTVTLGVSDSTPRHGSRVRFFGSVKPRHDGATLLIQRRKGHGYVTVAKARLKAAGRSRSVFSLRLRVGGDGVYRAVVKGDRSHRTGTSHTKLLNAH